MDKYETDQVKQAVREVLQEFFVKPVGCLHEWEVIGQYQTTGNPQTRCKKCGEYLTSVTSSTTNPDSLGTN